MSRCAVCGGGEPQDMIAITLATASTGQLDAVIGMLAEATGMPPGDGYDDGQICPACAATRTVADVLAALRRQAEAEQFAAAAQHDFELLDREPGLCQERIKMGQYARILLEIKNPGAKPRFCKRTATHDDGLCTQHHQQALFAAECRRVETACLEAGRRRRAA